MAEDPADRSEPSALDARWSALLGESPPVPPPPPARFWTEDQIVPFRGGHYRVVERLGSGGVGTTFKVVEIDRSGEDRGTFVAKVSHDQDAGRRTTHAYRRARSHVGRHPALSAILEVAPQWLENQFTALMTWIEGAPLRDFLDVFPLLAEEQGEVSGEALALRWLRDMCDALDVLHRSGLVHGDVSPANMIVSGQDLVLTDYDFVTKLGEKRPAPGTVLYCAPSVPDGGPAQRCDDIYALAASFFHLLFEREPFRYDGAIAKERGLNVLGALLHGRHDEASFIHRTLEDNCAEPSRTASAKQDGRGRKQERGSRTSGASSRFCARSRSRTVDCVRCWLV